MPPAPGFDAPGKLREKEIFSKEQGTGTSGNLTDKKGASTPP